MGIACNNLTFSVSVQNLYNMGLRSFHGIDQHLPGHLHQRILLPLQKKIMMIVEVILLKSSA